MDSDPWAKDMSNFGIALFMDVLGARVRNTAEAERLLEGITHLVGVARKEHLPDLRKAITGAGLEGEIDSPKVTVVGDAIVFTWVVRAHVATLLHCSLLAQDIFLEALSRRLPVRGAIGVGDIIYAEEENIVLGSGVTDAAEWYERGDILGVIASPRCGMLIEWIMEDMGRTEEQMSLFYMRSDVPMKDKMTTEKMWAVCWPHMYSKRCHDGGLQARKMLLHFLAEFDRSPRDERKYEFARAFFDEHVNNLKKWGAEGKARTKAQADG